jgi:ketosteroid isomerase-like protein
MTYRLIVLLALAMPIAARGAPDTSEAQAGKEIRESLARWVEASNRGDWKEAVEIWAPDLIGWYPGMPDDTYARETEGAAKGGAPRTRYDLEIKEVMVSGSLAVVRDVWTFTTTGTAGEKKVEKVKSFEVWRRQPDGTWRIARWISAPEPKP